MSVSTQIIVMQESSEAGISNPSCLTKSFRIRSPTYRYRTLLSYMTQQKPFVMFGRKRSKWTHNCSDREYSSQDLWWCNLDFSDIPSVWNSEGAGTGLLLTYWHQRLLRIDLCTMNFAPYLCNFSMPLSYNSVVLTTPYT